MKKVFSAGILAILMLVAMVSVAFAEDDGGSGDSGSSASTGSSAAYGGTPKKVCEGTRYSYDNTGVTSYRMKYLAKIAGKILDPRFETVLRSAYSAEGFSHTEKWKACAASAE